MSLLVNNTLANPQTSFYAAFGSGGGGGGGNTLDSPASIVPSPLDGSVSLVGAATGAGAAVLNLTAAASATQTIQGAINGELDVKGLGGNATVTVETQGSGTATMSVTSPAGPAALSVTSGGVTPATVSVNAAGTGAAIVGIVGTAGAATLNVEANGAGNEANITVDSANISRITIYGSSSSSINLGGTGGATPGLFNQGDGVIRISNNLQTPNVVSEVLTADVVNSTLKVKGLGGAPQVLLASQNIAPGNVTPTTFTVPNPVGEGLYCIMAASASPSTANSRDAQFSMMAYVNSAGRIQIGGNGGSTVGSVTGTESLEMFPLDGTTNSFLTYNGAQQLNNMSIVAFNISGPIPSAF
jgi:hypothetical protein